MVLQCQDSLLLHDLRDPLKLPPWNFCYDCDHVAAAVAPRQVQMQVQVQGQALLLVRHRQPSGLGGSAMQGNY